MSKSPTPEQIKDLRRRHHLTQRQLADSLYGVKYERVADWETDRRKMPPSIWWQMKIVWDKVDLWAEERDE